VGRLRRFGSDYLATAAPGSASPLSGWDARNQTFRSRLGLAGSNGVGVANRHDRGMTLLHVWTAPWMQEKKREF